MPKKFENVSKWRNFAKSGHPEVHLQGDILRSFCKSFIQRQSKA